MLRRIINHLRGMGPPPLGRWCLKDKSKNDWKIDTANTDHCGTCAYEQTKPVPKIIYIEAQPVTSKKESPLIISKDHSSQI
jgi:hypothetical protein